MALARDAGTETLRSGLFESCTSTAQILIVGEQHHIYTVISIIVRAMGVATDANYTHVYLEGYDAKAGTSAQGFGIFKQDMSAGETYVWNDKFSFTGHEPTDFTGPLSTIAKMDAIADQGSGVLQKLIHLTEASGDNMDVTVTYLDQNNT